jgi:ferredoxin-NADP reductase/predicted pyridoxine 5'-phosphate oxidase superfamily flavin-nucleotide-binding protein
MDGTLTLEKRRPWHHGELRMQRSAGVTERMEAVGQRSIRDHLIEQHRLFYPQLPFVVLGTVDGAGDVWATIRAGHPGFMVAHDPKQLDVALARDPTDPADDGMNDGDGIGLLGIELHTRRRNRLNGWIRRNRPENFSVAVEQSYGNCPQYIQLRDFAFVRDPSGPGLDKVVPQERLDGAAADLVRRADTFFVASYVVGEDGRNRVDVSHRGGRPGFVRLDSDGTLTIPDFSGNFFFNTLGNLLANPRAGLAFVDFDTGNLLQMTGDAEVILESPEIAAFQGAERLWRFHPRRIVSRLGRLPLRWRFSGGWSPNALLTGSWEEAARRLEAQTTAGTWRRFRVARVADESTFIRSLILEPTDGLGIIAHHPGQYLPIRVVVPGQSAVMLRSYTLSTAPSDGRYRISVKREGLVSAFLHQLEVGAELEVGSPSGTFTIDATARRPAVLIAAGIGITPMLSMLRHLVYEGARMRYHRPAWLLYSAHAKQERGFDQELARLVETSAGSIRLVRFLSDTDGAGPEDYEIAGRIDAGILTKILPFNDYEFFLCGPAPFAQSVYDGLRAFNIADDRIRAEAFGPSSVHRSIPEFAATPPGPRPATDPVTVEFRQSNNTAIWKPESGSLLELAEAAGLRPAYQCRAGTCGTCRTKMLDGAVAYRPSPSAAVGEGEVLICCAVPAEGREGGIILEL